MSSARLAPGRVRRERRRVPRARRVPVRWWLQRFGSSRFWSIPSVRRPPSSDVLVEPCEPLPGLRVRESRVEGSDPEDHAAGRLGLGPDRESECLGYLLGFCAVSIDEVRGLLTACASGYASHRRVRGPTSGLCRLWLEACHACPCWTVRLSAALALRMRSAVVSPSGTRPVSSCSASVLRLSGRSGRYSVFHFSEIRTPRTRPDWLLSDPSELQGASCCRC